jgi:hypothetical protein
LSDVLEDLYSPSAEKVSAAVMRVAQAVPA